MEKPKPALFVMEKPDLLFGREELFPIFLWFACTFASACLSLLGFLLFRVELSQYQSILSYTLQEVHTKLQAHTKLLEKSS